MRQFLLLLMVCFALAANGQTPMVEAEFEFTKTLRPSRDNDLEQVVDQLVNRAESDVATVRLITYWIANFISYDVVRYESGRNQKTSNIFRTRKGVCADYADLFKQMCTLANIECHIVSGYSKGYGYRPGKPMSMPDHAWNVVKLEGEYHFVDPTWASGGVQVNRAGKLIYKKGYNGKEILADFTAFSTTHLPADPQWQLTDSIISPQQFFGQDGYENMKKGGRQFFAFRDSIAAYNALGNTRQAYHSQKRAYLYYPTADNYKLLYGIALNEALPLLEGDHTTDDRRMALLILEDLLALTYQQHKKQVGKKDFYQGEITKAIRYAKYFIEATETGAGG